MEAQVKRLKRQQTRLLARRTPMGVRPGRRTRQLPRRFAAARPGATYARTMGATEKKNIDTATIALPGLAATGVLTLLNSCQAGGLPTNRVGRKIHMSSIFIRGTVAMAPTTTNSTSLRLVVFYDKQANKAAPVATDLLTTDSIASTNLLANSGRFKVLRDIWVPCIGTAGPQCVQINEYFKCNLKVEYIDGAGAGTIADITTGSLYALLYCSPIPGVAQVLSTLNARVRFSDL